MPIERVNMPLISGGISDSAADQGGMDPSEVLVLKNAHFDTPSTVSVRRGSIDGAAMQDDQGTPADVETVCFLGFWPSLGKMFAVSHSTVPVTDQHFVHELDTDGLNPSRRDLPAGAYEVATPLMISGAGWFNKTFYFCDVGQNEGMIKVDGNVAAPGGVTLPTFDVGGGAATLRPVSLFVHLNHLIILGYGDATDPTQPDAIRFSNIGNPDAWDAADIELVGQTEEPLTIGVSLGEYALLFKERKIHRMTGSDKLTWEFAPLPGTRGALGPRHAVEYDGNAWFIAEDGFCNANLQQSQLIVDRVKLKFANFDEADKWWVAAIPRERMVCFAVHERGASGLYPNLLVCVDVRTGNWAVRSYDGLSNMFHGATMPQVGGVAAEEGPTGPPTHVAASSINSDGWTANWTNGDSRNGVTTRHESRNQDADDPWVEDANETAGVTSSVLTGKDPGVIFEERVRHERNGIYSIYDPFPVVEVKTLHDPPTNLVATGLSDDTDKVWLIGVNTNLYSNIRIEREDQAVPGVWVLVTTLTIPGATFSTFDPGATCTLTYKYRARAERTGIADGPWSASSNAALACDPTGPS